MPKAKLIFKLPEESMEHLAALKAMTLLSSIREADQVLRYYTKHGEPSLENATAAIESARSILNEAIDRIEE